jgi:O-antigen/teichoic acid export membrane protein
MMRSPSIIGKRSVSPADTDLPAQESLSLRVRVARSMFWIAWSRGALQLLTFATTIFIARILLPDDYGVMALATSFTAHAGMLAEMGLGSAIIQFRDLNRRELDTCFWITMALALVFFAALFLGAPAIARWLAVPTLADVLPVLALVVPLTACRVVSDSLLRKRLALDRVSQAEVIGAVVTLPVTIGCALGGLGVWALVVGYLVGPAVRTAATVAFAPWLPRFRIGGERVREVVRFSLTTLGIRFMWSMREAGNALVLGKVTGQAAIVGLYTMADDVAHLPGLKISPVINMLTSPVMAELQTDIDRLREAFYRALRLTAALVVPTSAGIALVADDMVPVLLGPKWLAAAPLIRLLSLYAAVRAVDVMMPPVLFARRRERFLFWYCLVLLFVMPGAAVLGAVWDGATGMIVSYTAAYCAVMTLLAKETLVELKAKFSELWSQTWAIMAATAAMAVVVLILGELATRMQMDSPLLRLALLSFAGAATYGAILFAIGSQAISEGIEVAGWILRRHRA